MMKTLLLCFPLLAVAVAVAPACPVLPEIVEVDVQGRLESDFMLGFDGTAGPVVHVQGKTFVVRLNKEIGRLLDLDAMNGKIVRLHGTLGAWQTYVGPMVSDAVAPVYRIFNVSQFTLVERSYISHGESVELVGRPKFYRHIRFGRGAVAIAVAGQTYWLDFGQHDDLYKLAMTSNACVRIVGYLRPGDGAIQIHELTVETPAEQYRELNTGNSGVLPGHLLKSTPV